MTDSSAQNHIAAVHQSGELYTWGFGAAGPQLGAVGLPWAGLAGVRAENPAVANPSPFGGF